MFEQFRAEECAKKLNTHITRGLSEQEAGRRLLANGRNELKEKRKETAVVPVKRSAYFCAFDSCIGVHSFGRIQ